MAVGAVYQTLTPTPLELCEGLEQLRVLEHGYRIRVSRTDAPAIEVNTPADLELCLELGVEAVITDRPAYVLDQLGA